MNKYVVIAFAVMGAWFYEASGGSDFVPGSNSLVVFAEPKPVPPAPETRVERVARADTSDTNLTDVASTRLATAALPENATAGLTIARRQPVAEPALVPEPEVAEDIAAVVDAVVQETSSAPQVVEAVPEVVQRDPDPDPDYRFVEGDRVNLRGGPGTDYAVVGRLLRNDMVEVLEDNGDGWLHLRVPATGEEGWMADWLVTAAN